MEKNLHFIDFSILLINIHIYVIIIYQQSRRFLLYSLPLLSFGDTQNIGVSVFIYLIFETRDETA